MEEETSKSQSNNRLPVGVKPTHYDLTLSIDEVKRRVSGEVDITIMIEKPIDNRLPSKQSRNYSHAILNLFSHNPYQKISKQTEPDRILLNVDPSVKIESVQFFEFSDQNSNSFGKEKTKNSFKLDGSRQLMIIERTIEREAGKTGGLLSLKFKSKLRDDLRGIYEHSREGYGSFVISKFQPIDARLAFPCFDEPQFKATFNLTIRHNSTMQALSNTPVQGSEIDPSNPKVRTTKFQKTPKMSVHMLAFAVGKFESFDCQKEKGIDIPVKIHTPVGLRGSARFASGVACKSLDWMEEYTNILYPLKKFDLITVFEHEKDNYESWGLTFVRADLSLFNQETKDDSKIAIAVNVAHVVAHQWFGNLITAKWWDSIWITEMFAAQLAFKMLEDSYHRFESEYFVRLSLSAVLQTDWSIKSGLHPLAPNPNDLVTPEQINAIFDNLTFMKGASLAQLFTKHKHFAKQAVRQLLRESQYNNVDKDDLNRAFQIVEGTDQNFLDNYASQIYSPSYPVINLDQKDERIILTLDRVQATELGLSITFDGMGNTRPTIQKLETKNQELALPQGFDLKNGKHWFKLNYQPDISTYFRVNYSESLIDSLLRNAIEKKIYDPLDRLHVLDDAKGLFKSDAMSRRTFEHLLDCYKKETHGGVIMGIVEAAKALLEPKSPTDDLSNYSIPPAIHQLFIDLIKQHKFKPKSLEFFDQRAFTSTLNLLIQMGDQDVINTALEKYINSEGVLSAYLREPIYDAVVKYGSNENRSCLYQHLRETNSPEEYLRLKNALLNSGNLSYGELVRRYLEIVRVQCLKIPNVNL